MRILIVEDEEKSASFLRKGLSEEGFIPDVVGTGTEALQLAKSIAYELIVLDLMLPMVDGWTVLTELRRGGIATPLVVLSARDTVQDRVRGLELGADDYMVKPFAFAELLARMRSVLRRGPVRHSETIRIADLEIDLSAHRVCRGGTHLDLTPKEFALLSLLARRHGEVQSRSLIAEQVWDMNFESDTNVVDVHVRRLRAKVDDPFEQKLIRTVRGIGYVLQEKR